MSIKTGKMGGNFEYSGIGYLIIRTTTARYAVPVAGATVIIKCAEHELAEIMYTLKTDQNGMTEKVALPCPPKSAQQVYGKRPYCLYDIYVQAEGYIPRSYIGISIFNGITSYHTVDLLPLPESGLNSQLFEDPQIVSPNPNDVYG